MVSLDMAGDNFGVFGWGLWMSCGVVDNSKKPGPDSGEPPRQGEERGGRRDLHRR
jgi:hypothetical protein